MTVSGPTVSGPTVSGPTSATVGGVDVDRVAAAVLACPLVAALHPGPHGTTATLLPGRRVVGVRVAEAQGSAVRLEIAVAAPLGAVLEWVGEQVRDAVRALAPAVPVDVVVGDVVGDVV